MNMSEKFKIIYDELVKAIEQVRTNANSTQSDNYPTPQWVSGKLNQLKQLPYIEKSVNDVNINPQILEDYKKFITLKNIFIKYNLIKRDGKNYVKTDLGSKFVQELQKSYKVWSTKEQFANIASDENIEWYNNLSSDDKKLIDIYQELTAKEYAYLIGLLSNNTDINKDSEKTEKLLSLNLLNSDMTINLQLVEKLLNFLAEHTYARLKSFNKDISYTTDRISADRALLKNYLHRNIDRNSSRRNSLAVQSDLVLDKLTYKQKQILLYNYKKNLKFKTSDAVYKELVDLKLIDSSGEMTLLGLYICKLLTTNLDIDSMQASGEQGTLFSRLKKSEIDSDSNLNNRRNEKAGTRSSSFSDFLKK